MADNTVINQPSTIGQSIATKDIAGINHELVLLEFGNGAGGATEVSATDPMPVEDIVAETALTNIAAGTAASLGQKLMAASVPVVISSDQSAIPTVEAAATALNSGVTTVTTAGTRVQTASNACKSVTVKAKLANTGVIYVGGSGVTSANGFQLAAGDTVSFDISNTNLIYIDSSASGEGISFIFIS